MHKPPVRRRFIAGAVCPRCSAMDTIVVDRDSDMRECVTCGFQDVRPTAKTPVTTTEPATRVSRAAARRADTPAAVVRILDPGDDKR